MLSFGRRHDSFSAQFTKVWIFSSGPQKYPAKIWGDFRNWARPDEFMSDSKNWHLGSLLQKCPSVSSQPTIQEAATTAASSFLVFGKNDLDHSNKRLLNNPASTSLQKCICRFFLSIPSMVVCNRTSLAPLASPYSVLRLIGVEADSGLVDYQGRAGIISIVGSEPSPGHIRCRS